MRYLQASWFILIFWTEDFLIHFSSSSSFIITCHHLWISHKLFLLLQSMSSENLSLFSNRIELVYQLQVYETDKTTFWWHELQDQTLVIIFFMTRNIQSLSLSLKASSLLLLRHRRVSSLISDSAVSTRYSFLQN